MPSPFAADCANSSHTPSTSPPRTHTNRQTALSWLVNRLDCSCCGLQLQLRLCFLLPLRSLLLLRCFFFFFLCCCCCVSSLTGHRIQLESFSAHFKFNCDCCTVVRNNKKKKKMPSVTVLLHCVFLGDNNNSNSNNKITTLTTHFGLFGAVQQQQEEKKKIWIQFANTLINKYTHTRAHTLSQARETERQHAINCRRRARNSDADSESQNCIRSPWRRSLRSRMRMRIRILSVWILCVLRAKRAKDVWTRRATNAKYTRASQDTFFGLVM